MEYPNLSKVEGQPSFEKSPIDILNSVKVGGAIKVLDPLDYITSRQRCWYKGICLPYLAKQSGDANSTEWWDNYLKKECNGLSLLKKEIFFIEDIMGNEIPVGRLTTKGVGKKNMRLFIDAILEKSDKEKWELKAPDKELRK